MTLHSISFAPSTCLTPAFPGPSMHLHISFKLEPVVEHEYCGYWLNATALVTPSLRICSRQSSVSGWTYRNAV